MPRCTNKAAHFLPVFRACRQDDNAALGPGVDARAARPRRFQRIDITRLPTHRIVKSGIAFVPEDRGIFPTVTVEEHLAIAYGASKHRPRRKPIEHVFEIFPRLAERRRHRPAGAKSPFQSD
jgi:hypothetical protein